MATDNKQAEKTSKVVSKSFMTVGPTLHYSHRNVQTCWLLAIVAFGASCLFWSRILTGSFWSFKFDAIASLEFGRLGQSVITGVSIFQYPWQILILGLLMGILAVVPVLISQLMSFRYSLLFLLAVFFLANLPAFAVCLLVSCVAAACRPLRFRSRFIAIALCTAPQLLYWGYLGYFGGAKDVEPIKWGFSFAPWICAWLIGLGIAGLVLGIGHFTRYRPGLVWTFTSVFLLLAIVTFEIRIGFDELDYQLYVAKNNPEDVSEFHDHNITEALNTTAENPAIKGYFFFTEPIQLRAQLKREIQRQLRHDRWPGWFSVPDELKYREKRQALDLQYERFINPPKPWWMPAFLHTRWLMNRSRSDRMPIALYYKAVLNEFSPDIKLLGQKEILHFYNDYEKSQDIWLRLYTEFGDSPESLEAQWRIARYLAGLEAFEQADKLLAEAQTVVAHRLKLREKERGEKGTFFSPFRPPADSVMTAFKLTELQGKLSQMRNLISAQNRTGKGASAKHLAKFVMLNRHSEDYAQNLDELGKQMGDNNPLRDNVLLAQTMLVADEQLRADRLRELHERFQNTDGGMQALYELALLKILLWRQHTESNSAQKKEYLADARATLTSFISMYPAGIFTDRAKKHLADLPEVE